MASDDLAAACRWIDSRLHEVWSRTTLLPSLKAAGELGHAADHLMRTNDPRCRELGRAWLLRAWEWIERGELLRRLVDDDSRRLPVMVSLLPFHLQGLCDDSLIHSIERHVHRATLRPLEWTIVCAALEVLGIDCGDEPKRLARTNSMLASGSPPDRIPIDAIYLLAHECLYATRWGRIAPAYSPEVHAYLDRALPVLLERCRGLHDPDVTAEVIIMARLHGIVADEELWSILGDARQPDGSLRAPAQSQRMLPRSDHPILGRALHTTIAAIIAWASAR